MTFLHILYKDLRQINKWWWWWWLHGWGRASSNLWQRPSTQRHILWRLWRNTDHGDYYTNSVTNVTIIKRTQYQYYDHSFHFNSKLRYVMFFFVIYISTYEIDHKCCYKLLTRSTGPIVNWDLENIVFSQYFSKLLSTEGCHNIIWNSPWS